MRVTRGEFAGAQRGARHYQGASGPRQSPGHSQWEGRQDISVALWKSDTLKNFSSDQKRA